MLKFTTLRIANEEQKCQSKVEIKYPKEPSDGEEILHIVITVLTAIATTFGVTSCMGV